MLAGVAVVVAVVRRSRFALVFAALGGLAALTVVVDPQGSLYNVRFLPLYFVCVYLMAGWLFAVTVTAVARWWRRARLGHFSAIVASAGVPAAADRPPWAPVPHRPRTSRWAPGAVVGPLVGLLAACVVVVPPFIFPATSLPVHVGANEVSGWAAWNYSGYEGKASWPEYHGLVTTMARVGQRYGCGRAMWEYNADLNRFGTPESLMLLPYWTNRCIDSMEGLLFESSATTPYHFLNQAELSVSPSDPMVGLPYGAVNVPLGIEHLQLLGVRYFMANSPQVVQAAAADPSLVQVATSGPWPSVPGSGTPSSGTTWHIYLVKDSALVTPLANEPAVLDGIAAKQASWLDPSVSWYDTPSRWPVELAQSGPTSWPRVPIDTTSEPAVHVAPTTVSHIALQDQSLHFHVSRTGTPGAREDLLLPELARQRGPRSLPGDPEPDGGGAHEPRGEPDLRLEPGQQPRPGLHTGRHPEPDRPGRGAPAPGAPRAPGRLPSGGHARRGIRTSRVGLSGHGRSRRHLQGLRHPRHGARPTRCEHVPSDRRRRGPVHQGAAPADRP